MTSARLLQCLCVVSVLLAGCGGSGGGSTPTNANAGCAQSVTQGFNGNIEFGGAGDGSGGDGGGAGAGGGLGKVLGGKLSVTDLSDGAVVGSAITDSVNGLVTIKTCSRKGPFLLTLEGQPGATYYDEGINQMSDFGAGKVLHALVDKWDEHVGVSPLTEAAYRYALNNYKANPLDIATGKTALVTTADLVGLTIDQVVAANTLVLKEINRQITTNYQMASIKSLPTPIDTNSSSTAIPNSRYGKSAVLNGGFIKAGNIYNGNISQPALAFANDLALDLTDGVIDGFSLDGRQVNSAATSSYDFLKLKQQLSIGTDSIATSRSAAALASKPIIIDGFSSNIPGFDTVTLTSDGSIQVTRNSGTTSTLIKNYLTNVKQIAKASATNYALKYDGTLWIWGDNHYCGSNLIVPGIGSFFPLSNPVQIQGLRDIVALSSNGSYTVAVDRLGNIYDWGTYFSFVSNTDTCASLGAPRYKINNAKSVSQSGNGNFVLTSDGKVFSWGSGNENGLGYDIGIPTQVNNVGTAIRLNVVDGYIQVDTVNGTKYYWRFYPKDLAVPKVVPNSFSSANDKYIDFAARQNDPGVCGASSATLLYADGSVRQWDPRDPSAIQPVLSGVPPIRYLRSVIGDTLMYSFDGRVFSVTTGKSVTTVEEFGTGYFAPLGCLGDG